MMHSLGVQSQDFTGLSSGHSEFHPSATSSRMEDSILSIFRREGILTIRMLQVGALEHREVNWLG